MLNGKIRIGILKQFKKSQTPENYKTYQVQLSHFRLVLKMYDSYSLTAKLDRLYEKEQADKKEDKAESLFDFNSLTKDHKAEKEYLEKRMEEDKKKTNGGLSNTH